MNELSDAEIERIVAAYKKKREYDKAKYQKKKDDPEFIKQNRERAARHYEKNAGARKAIYQKDKEYYTAKSSYNYYKRTNNLSVFKDKHKEKYDLLVERKYITSDLEILVHQH